MTIGKVFSGLRQFNSTMLAAGFVALTSSKAHAHGGNHFQHAFDDFFYGFEATFSFASAILPTLATGLFAGTRPTFSLTWTAGFLLVGFLLGVLVAPFGWIPTDMTAYVATILIGLIVAASPNIERWLSGTLIVGTTAITANVMFSGYDWLVIPLFSYLGVGTAILLGSMTTCLVIQLVIASVRYDWIVIAWRAIASWIVAVSILMIALLISENM
ncbi:MAG: hypothetical protein AAGA76_02590 [Pseudomonadota bacterium]